MESRSEKELRGAKRNSFIERARRQQILEVSINGITNQGYKNISMADIATEAGVSKGLLYYHFKSKTELVGEIWSAFIDELFDYRKACVDAQTSASEKLRVYVMSHFDFLRANVNKFVALFEIGLDLKSKGKRSPWTAGINERCFRYLGSILLFGQSNGEFRSFSPEKFAPVIQGAIDGIALQWFSDPEGVDLADCEDELQKMIELSTRQL